VYFGALQSLFRSTPILGSILQIAAVASLCTSAVGVCAAVVATLSSAFVAGVTSGNLGAALKAGLITAVTIVAFNVVGGMTNVAEGGQFSLLNHTPAAFGTGAYAFNVAGHAAVGCLTTMASGGKCGSGALAGGAGAAATPLIQTASNGSFVGGLAMSSVVGGVASVAGGGKFGNGAVTAAFGYLFNSGAGSISRMLDGQDAHRALQQWLQRQGIDGLFTEASSDGLGTSFWGRVDIGNAISGEIWEIKPNNPVQLFLARVMAEFYAATADGPTQYDAGGNGLPLPTGALNTVRGSYTYTNAGDGAILWSYNNANQSYTFSPSTSPKFVLPPITPIPVIP